jgi:quercetin dioxygenase-like cupin family protein
MPDEIPSPVCVDAREILQSDVPSGPQWAHESEDLDITLLSWQEGKQIEAHSNNEVDVVLIGIAGTGQVTINGAEYEMHAGVTLLIPKGSERAIAAKESPFSYLSIHRRRRGLLLTKGRGGPPL